MTGAELRARRTALRLSQAKLARLLGVDQGTVFRWETERREIPPYLSLALDGLVRDRPKPSP